MSKKGAKGFLSYIEEGKFDEPPEVETVGNQHSSLHSSTSSNTSHSESLSKSSKPSKSSRSKLVNKLLRSSTNRHSSSTSPPSVSISNPSTHERRTSVSTSTSPIPEQQMAMEGKRMKGLSDFEGKTKRSPMQSRMSMNTTPTNMYDYSPSDREYDSSPNFRAGMKDNHLNKRRPVRDANLHGPMMGIPMEDWQDQFAIGGNKRHTVHIHLGPTSEEDATEQYLKAWAKLQIRDSIHHFVPPPRRVPNSELLPSSQEGMPFLRRGLMMVNSSTQTASDAATQTLQSENERKYSSQNLVDKETQIRRTSSLQNMSMDMNTPKQRQSMEMARKASVRERNRVREALKHMISGGTSTANPKIQMEPRISKSSTVTRNNSWNQLQQLDQRIEMKQKQLADRGILPPSTSPSPASAPETNNWPPLLAPKPNYLNPANGPIYRPFADHRGTVGQASFEDIGKAIRQFSSVNLGDNHEDESERLRCAAPNPIEMLVGGFEVPVAKTAHISDFSSTRPSTQATKLQISKNPIQINFISPPDQSKNNIIFDSSSSAFSPATEKHA